MLDSKWVEVVFISLAIAGALGFVVLVWSIAGSVLVRGIH